MIQFDEHIFQMGWFNHHLVLFHQFQSQNSHGEDLYTTTVDGSELPRPIHRLDGAKTRPEMMVDKVPTSLNGFSGEAACATHGMSATPKLGSIRGGYDKQAAPGLCELCSTYFAAGVCHWYYVPT